MTLSVGETEFYQLIEAACRLRPRRLPHARWVKNGGAIAPPSAGQKRATGFAANLHVTYIMFQRHLERYGGVQGALHLF